MGLGDNLEPAADRTLSWPLAAPGAFYEHAGVPESTPPHPCLCCPRPPNHYSWKGSPWAAEQFGKQGIRGRPES